MNDKVIIPDGICFENNVLIDKPLKREICLQPTSLNLQKYNSDYYVNIKYSRKFKNFMRLFLINDAYRIDVEGDKFIKILSKFIYESIISNLGIVLLFILFVSVITNNLFMAFIMVGFVINLFAACCAHEALHIYIYRKLIKSNDSGSMIVHGLKVFCIFPEQHIAPQKRIIVALAPSLLGILGLAFIILIDYITQDFVIRATSYLFASIWISNLLNLLPWTQDMKNVYIALKDLISCNK